MVQPPGPLLGGNGIGLRPDGRSRLVTSFRNWINFNTARVQPPGRKYEYKKGKPSRLPFFYVFCHPEGIAHIFLENIRMQ